MIPYVNGKTLKKIDEKAESEYGISLLQLMEVAGARMAGFLRERYAPIAQKEILIICGKGNNGGDGLVCARVLHNWGAKVSVLLAFPEEAYEGVVKQNLESCHKLGIECAEQIEEPEPSLIVDCLFGFGFKGELKKDHELLIKWMNAQHAKIMSCDLPSGMESIEFKGESLTVQADSTLTFTIPKEVFASKEARERAGEIYILDIGIPKPLYYEMGVEKSLFGKKSWVRW